MICRLACAGRIQTHGDPVVVEGSVAAADGGAYLVGFGIETMEGKIDVAVVVGNPDFSPQIGLRAAKWTVRNPFTERQRRSLPDLVVQNAIDLRRLRSAWHPEFRTGLRTKRNGRKQSYGKGC